MVIIDRADCSFSYGNGEVLDDAKDNGYCGTFCAFLDAEDACEADGTI